MSCAVFMSPEHSEQKYRSVSGEIDSLLEHLESNQDSPRLDRPNSYALSEQHGHLAPTSPGVVEAEGQYYDTLASPDPKISHQTGHPTWPSRHVSDALPYTHSATGAVSLYTDHVRSLEPRSESFTSSIHSWRERRSPNPLVAQDQTQTNNATTHSTSVEHPTDSYSPIQQHEANANDNVDSALAKLTSQDLSRNPSSASRYTVPMSIFRGFDGEHYEPVSNQILEDDEENEDIEDEESTSQHTQPWVEPPPEDDMVYYPAPVPMTLNMPQRLSRQVPATVQARRRSRVLNALPVQARKSAAWLTEESDDANNSRSELSQQPIQSGVRETMNLDRLPPQLRASVFFEHSSVPHKIELKHGSAVATLDSLLDASAHAPVAPGSTAFTDLRPRRSSTPLLHTLDSDARKSNVSPSMNRRPSMDRLSGFALRSISRLSNFRGASPEDPEVDESTALQVSHSPVNDDMLHIAGGEDDEHSAKDDHDIPDEDELGQEELIGQPTTLLAELQLRKQHLKSRNRTAGPVGVHSTLLQMDAVAQVEKSRRLERHTRLAWENPNAADKIDPEDDDDVPLGVLYSSKIRPGHRHATSQPHGLIERRDREENEPLSRRRNRLRGVPAQRSTTALGDVSSHQASDDSDSQHEGETLAQRTRRLRTRKALDDAIGLGTEGNEDAQTGHNRTVSDAFASEMMSQLGVTDSTTGDRAETKKVAQAEPEETLGQRRKRLQAEREAAGAQGLHAAQSYASLNGANQLYDMRGVPNGSTPALAGQQQYIVPQYNTLYPQYNYDMNQRSFSNGFGMSSTNNNPQAFQPLMTQEGPGIRKSFAPGMYNDGAGGMALGVGMDTNMGPGNRRQSRRASQHLPLQQWSATGQYSDNAQQSIPVQQQRTPTPVMPRLFAPGTYAHAPEQQIPKTEEWSPSMDPSQRDDIDRWRQSVFR